MNKAYLIVFNDIEIVNDTLFIKRESAELELEKIKKEEYRKGFEHFYEIAEFYLEGQDER